MKNLIEEAAKIKGIVNPALNDIDIDKLFVEQREKTNKMLSNIKMPDAYYEQQRRKAEGK